VYSPPFILFNAHLETIYPALFRKVEISPYHRERISTPDNDFLDLDWLKRGSSKVVIISHGLEGSSHRAYVKGMAKVFFANCFDVIAWNYRGCSGEMNKTLRFYHSGATDDLEIVIQHALQLGFEEINLVGFSLGGNISLKYLGENSDAIHSAIHRAVVFSVPMDLDTSCQKISSASNFIYSNRFLKSLKYKIKWKASMMDGLDVAKVDKIKSIEEFDDRFTAPLHGFNGAKDYYKKCSSIFFVEGIQVPTLIVNAWNDPFLSAECFPENINNPRVTFEKTSRGGHVGFSSFTKNGVYWSEQRALDFILKKND
jgi:hypothetical protein